MLRRLRLEKGAAVEQAEEVDGIEYDDGAEEGLAWELEVTDDAYDFEDDACGFDAKLISASVAAATAHPRSPLKESN